MIANTKLPLFYNKNNKIVVKFNNSALVNILKKQILEEVLYKIDVYFIENKIIIIKLYIAQTLLNKNIVI